MSDTVDDNIASQDSGEQMGPADDGEELPLVQTDNSRDPTPSANTRRKLDRERMVKNCIDEVQASSGTALELNNLEISVIPEPLLRLKHVQYLYLAGNKLTQLPENFFECLSSVVWLDLRRNYLASIPSAYIGRHRCLRTLLLECNELRNLPLELGLVSTLTGLNIASNPLEFPPEEVIQKGTQSILSFFRELLQAKSQGRVPQEPSSPDESAESTEGGPGENGVDGGQDDPDSDLEWGRRPTLQRGVSQDSSFSVTSGKTDPANDLIGPVPQSASLHTHSTYSDLKKVQMNRMRKQTSRQHQQQQAVNRKNRTPKPAEQRRYEEPPPQELIEQRYLEERKMARLRELKDRQNQLLQKRKDYEQLKAFRDDSRHLQQRKEREKRMKGGKLDYDKAAETAPFDVNSEHMKMPSNEERIAADIREKHEQIRGQRGRALSPEAILRLEEARRERDRQLEKRIREHTASMQERKRRPKGNPQEEMHAAMEELRIAEQLQLEIAARRKDLEYRFTAFTGDIVPSHSSSQKRLKVKQPLASIMPGRT